VLLVTNPRTLVLNANQDIHYLPTPLTEILSVRLVIWDAWTALRAERFVPLA